jgi:hypothetical protein
MHLNIFIHAIIAYCMYGGFLFVKGQHKIEFIPEIVGPILEMTLIPETGLFSLVIKLRTIAFDTERPVLLVQNLSAKIFTQFSLVNK